MTDLGAAGRSGMQVSTILPRTDERFVEPANPHQAVAARVSWWAEVLGVSHWRIAVATNAENRHLNRSSTARLHRTEYYDIACFLFRGAPAETGIYAVSDISPTIDHSIVHELLHLVLDDVDRAETDLLRFIEDDKTREVLGDRLRQREEQVVENLTRALVALAYAPATGPGRGDPPRMGAAFAKPELLEMPMFSEDGPDPDGPDDIAEERIGAPDTKERPAVEDLA